MIIMHILHELIPLTSKMAEGAKQDAQWWKETVLVLQEGKLS